jgi:hypothetical protein
MLSGFHRWQEGQACEKEYSSARLAMMFSLGTSLAIEDM